MKIEYLGHSCFCLQDEKGRKIITDPYTNVGYELPLGLEADIVTTSHGHFDHNYTAAIGGAPCVFHQEGNYEHDGVKIVGKHTWHDPERGILRGDNVIFRFTIGGVDICHFGDLGEEYSKEIGEFLDGADVWLIPVGGRYTIDARQAAEYIRRGNPKLVIPMHYRPCDGSLDIATIDRFLQCVHSQNVVHCPNGEYCFTKADLTDGEQKIIYMERKK